MFLFLFVFSLNSSYHSVNGGDNEEEDEEEEDKPKILTEENFIEENLEYIQNLHDPLPKSSVAYVTTYTNDESPYFGYLQHLIALGYTLKLLNPNIDRVVIVRQEFKEQASIIKLIEKSWTHILFRSPLKWPTHFYKKGDVYHAKWFKFYAWTLTQYKKILVVGCDILVFVDLSMLFTYKAPAASYYFSEYSLKQEGPFFNSDFMLIEPDMSAFASLLRLTLPYINNENKDSILFGSDDSAPLHLYYQREITLLPMFVVHENGGYKHTILGNPQDPTMRTIRACAVHFPNGGKPWKRYTLYSEVWAALSLVIFEKLDIPFHVKSGYTLHATKLWNQIYGDTNAKKLFWSPDVDTDEDDEIGEDYYPECHHSGARQNMAMLCLTLFISLLMLKVLLKSNNPFNIFLSNVRVSIDQFIRLENDHELPLMDDNFDFNVQYPQNNNPTDVMLIDIQETISNKPKIKKKKKKKKR